MQMEKLPLLVVRTFIFRRRALSDVFAGQQAGLIRVSRNTIAGVAVTIRKTGALQVKSRG